MKTLARPDDRAQLVERLRRLRPDSQREWGRMNAPQMVMHLSDAFLGLLGERTRPANVEPTSPAPRRSRSRTGQLIAKWYAVYSPLPWPRGFRTRPEIDSEKGGTKPGVFAADVAALEALAARFADRSEEH